jgi:hypothetical protein
VLIIRWSQVRGIVGTAASSGLALRRNQRRHPPRRPVLFGAHDFVTRSLDPGFAILHGGPLIALCLCDRRLIQVVQSQDLRLIAPRPMRLTGELSDSDPPLGGAGASRGRSR